MGRTPEGNDLHPIVEKLDSLLERLEESFPKRDPSLGRVRAETPASVLEDVYGARRIRNAVFGLDADLFGEPAWDILLDAAIMAQKGKQVSVTSACLASGVPSTTALRYISALENRGLLSREADALDHRKRYIVLTMKGKRLLKQYVEALSDTRNGHSRL